MKKLIMLVTMLLVPALASAWTLPVKVTNNTAGINAGNKATVTIGAASTDVAVGTRYFYPAATVASVSIAISNLANVDSITLDGAPQPIASPLVVAKTAASLRSVAVNYKTTAAIQTAAVTVSQTANGLTTLKIGSSTSVSGWSSVAVGSAVQVVPAPNTNATLVGVTLNGAPLAAPYFFTVADTTADVVSATYALKPVITGVLSAPTSGDVGGSVIASASGSSVTGGGALSYAWVVNGVAAGTAATQSVMLNPGQNTVEVTISSAGAADVKKGQYITGVDAIAADNYSCTSCHSGSTPAVVTGYATSSHAAVSVTCIDCHTATAHNKGVSAETIQPAFPFAVLSSATGTYPIMNSVQLAKGDKVCSVCHTDASHHSQTAAAPYTTCTQCHGTGDAHAIVGDCLGCHAIGQNAGAGYVQDNSGVRAIVGEFSKRSHHVTGRDVKNTDCAVCHLEGKADGARVVVDTNYHMKDAKTYLRNGNVGLVSPDAAFAWDPAAPDHTLMDNFCMSCHNEAGAPTAAAALAGVTGYAGTALNPFGDTVSNDYDQVSRVNVVGVYEQFDTNNSSHHAVRGQKYTSQHLNAAAFTLISTANYQFIEEGTNKPIKGTKALAGTMHETDKFVTTYTTLAGAALADDNVLHCGDCHTVGQFRAADVDPAVGSFNKEVIGAHGSNNEYMLRNSNGDDTFNKDALVCYICHKYAQYGDAASAHNGTNSAGVHCNGDVYNTAGLVGVARLAAEEGWLDGMTPELFEEEVAAGTYGGTGGSSIFGIKCSVCHNASDAKTFGGIHGNAHNASYTTYSGAKSANTVQVSAPVSRKPYRFMPGLGNFRYNGGDAPGTNNGASWTVKTLSTINKQGCYTLNGSMTSKSPTTAANAGANVNPTTAAVYPNDNGILGSWGACTDHSGTSYGGGRAASRTILRPLTY